MVAVDVHGDMFTADGDLNEGISPGTVPVSDEVDRKRAASSGFLRGTTIMGLERAQRALPPWDLASQLQPTATTRW